MDNDKPIFQYSRLSLVQTKEGLSYFGLHNEDYSNSQEGEITLHAVKEIPTQTLNLVVGGAIRSLGEKIGILEALEIQRGDLLAAVTLGKGPSEFFKDKEEMTISRSEIERMVDVPDFHHSYCFCNPRCELDLTSARID